MKYLCLVIVDEKKLEAMPEKDARALDRESLAYDDALKTGGYFLAAQALEPVSMAKTLRIRSGKLSVTDGPFAEAREQVGGFILLEAENMNQAIELAQNIPVLRFGAVELRAVKALVETQAE